MRLIDADAFKEYLRKGTEANADIIPQRLVDTVLDIMDGIMLDIDEQPTVDAVPVVRCKDCTYYCPLDDSRPSNCLMSGYLCVRKDDFCSCGKGRR